MQLTLSEKWVSQDPVLYHCSLPFGGCMSDIPPLFFRHSFECHIKLLVYPHYNHDIPTCLYEPLYLGLVNPRFIWIIFGWFVDPTKKKQANNASRSLPPHVTRAQQPWTSSRHGPTPSPEKKWDENNRILQIEVWNVFANVRNYVQKHWVPWALQPLHGSHPEVTPAGEPGATERLLGLRNHHELRKAAFHLDSNWGNWMWITNSHQSFVASWIDHLFIHPPRIHGWFRFSVLFVVKIRPKHKVSLLRGSLHRGGLGWIPISPCGYFFHLFSSVTSWSPLKIPTVSLDLAQSCGVQRGSLTTWLFWEMFEKCCMTDSTGWDGFPSWILKGFHDSFRPGRTTRALAARLTPPWPCLDTAPISMLRPCLVRRQSNSTRGFPEIGVAPQSSSISMGFSLRKTIHFG